jgi:hypothetical protein
VFSDNHIKCFKVKEKEEGKGRKENRTVDYVTN